LRQEGDVTFARARHAALYRLGKERPLVLRWRCTPILTGGLRKEDDESKVAVGDGMANDGVVVGHEQVGEIGVRRYCLAPTRKLYAYHWNMTTLKIDFVSTSPAPGVRSASALRTNAYGTMAR
jgi:hypothetical protein